MCAYIIYINFFREINRTWKRILKENRLSEKVFSTFNKSYDMQGTEIIPGV